MFLAIAEDLRIVFLRLAERIDNLKTLEFLPKERRIDYAKDSLEIYAPLAERLGMGKAKTQIEDIAFKHAYPDKYKEIIKVSKPYYKDAEKRIKTVRSRILKELKKHTIDGEIYGRRKGIYSFWCKYNRPGIEKDLEKVIYDVVALRIIVNEIKECYVALSIVHKLYNPVPYATLKDFIATPKPNGYRSIHTRVFGSDKKPFEVQIRTHEMHEDAEYGAAAHWAYSDKKQKGASDDDLEKKGVTIKNDKLNWVKELAKWQKEIKNSEEFLEAVKFDALSSRIFVFSPKGDVYDLPENSTPVDFAYAVHTDLGKYIKGAKVNGKIVGLDYQLQNGQVVEILKTKEERKPNSDWLKFVITTLAKRQIKKKLNMMRRIDSKNS
jgi:GTP pyrophosphokinase